ncbi:MAG: PKD domain-containing protein [Planctomycetota bacterium]
MQTRSLTTAAALLLAAATTAQNQVVIPAHSNVYNGYTRGYTFTAQNTFILQQLELPLDAFQTGDSASFYLRVNGANTFFNVGGTSAVQSTSIVINPGDIVDVFGNWSPAAPGTFTAHNSYTASVTGYPTTIEGAATTLYRNGVQNDIGNPAYVQGNNILGLTTTGQLGRVWMYTTPPSGLFANFTATPTAGPVGMTVNFTDTTFTSDPGGVLTWDWDLDGDGISDSNVQNPSFTYNTCGSYDVSLTVTDASHPASTVSRTGYIEVGITPISPSFTFTSLAPGVFQFTDTSTPVPSAWAWDLDGDGITDSTAQNPVWAYASPCTSVNVSLQVWSNCAGPWSTSNPIVLSPLSATAVPFTGGIGTTSTTVLGNMFDLTVTAAEGINVCAITQGLYTYAGPFNVAVYVTDGSYIGKEANAAAWRLVATGSGTANGGTLAPSTPYPIALNQSFYLPSGNYGMVVYLSNANTGTMYIAYTGAPQGPFVNPDVTFFPNPTTAPGMVSTALFTGAGITGRCWNGTLHYSKAGNGDLAGYGFFGPGCAGSLGVSHLTANSLPVIGTAMSVTVDNLPTNAAIMVTGLSKSSWLLGALPFDLAAYGAPGCLLRVRPDANLLLLGTGNSAQWPFAIPNNAGLVGVNMYNQAIVLSPGTNAAGAVGSDAAGMMIGL